LVTFPCFHFENDLNVVGLNPHVLEETEDSVMIFEQGALGVIYVCRILETWIGVDIYPEGLEIWSTDVFDMVKDFVDIQGNICHLLEETIFSLVGVTYYHVGTYYPVVIYFWTLDEILELLMFDFLLF